jgi:hypothetical protein
VAVDGDVVRRIGKYCRSALGSHQRGMRGRIAGVAA